MSAPFIEVRLRFRKKSNVSADEIMKRVQVALDENKESIVGRIERHHARIRIVEAKRHFWSPQLSLNVEEYEGETEVRGLYGPKPDIWLGYMFTYFFLGVVTLLLSMWGLSRYNLGLSSYILWVIPFLLGGIVVLWFTSRTGQRLGKDETKLIHAIVSEKVLFDMEEG